jgi:hypothetical protein
MIQIIITITGDSVAFSSKSQSPTKKERAAIRKHGKDRFANYAHEFSLTAESAADAPTPKRP